MKAGEQARYLEALDECLLPLGYRRQRRESAWRRMDARDRLWVHLNFGLGVINPSVGVCYADLAQLLPSESGAQGAVLNTGLSLTTLSGRQYTGAALAVRLATDLVDIGLPALTKLRDRSAVIDRLISGRPGDWPVAGAMIRMRLLPLLLADRGRVDEALVWVAAFEKEPDQMIPGYATFAACFRSRFATSQDRP